MLLSVPVAALITSGMEFDGEPLFRVGRFRRERADAGRTLSISTNEPLQAGFIALSKATGRKTIR